MTQTALKFAPIIAGVFIVIWLANGLARLTWTLTGEPPGVRASVSGRILTNVAVPKPPDIDAIVAMAPFGAPVAKIGAIGTGSNAAISLVLQGVLLAADPRQSVAIIAAAAGRAMSYFPGDTLPGGGVLIRVEAMGVVIRLAGREQTLSFPPLPSQTSAKTQLAGGSSGTPGTRSATPLDEVIVRARQRIAQNPKTLLDELGVKDTSEGYVIGDAENSMTRRAGFKAGDTIVRVNGVQVGNIEADRQLFEDVVAAGQARVEVVRDGRVAVLTFPLR